MRPRTRCNFLSLASRIDEAVTRANFVDLLREKIGLYKILLLKYFILVAVTFF